MVWYPVHPLTHLNDHLPGQLEVTVGLEEEGARGTMVTVTISVHREMHGALPPARGPMRGTGGWDLV
jgi:hypothetical protein